MFYRKKLLTKSSKTYKLSYTAFSAGMNSEIDENLLPHKYAIMTYNYKIKDGKLSSGHGFKPATLPLNDCIGERELSLNAHKDLTALHHFRDYDYENKRDIDRLVFFNQENKKLYWIQIESYDPYTYPLFSTPYESVPTMVNYRYNGNDCMFISSPSDILRVFKTGATAEEIENGPKIISMCRHYERIFAILEGEKISLAFSANLDPTNWNFDIDEGGFIDFVDERGKLEKVVSFNDYVYVFREHGISRITAYGDQSEFSVNHIYTSSSKIYGQSVAVCGEIIMFLANDGIYAFDGLNVKKIELGFEKYLSKRNNLAVGAFHKGKYYVACQALFDGETSEFKNNNVLIEIDADTFEVNLTKGVDINSMLALRYKNVEKLLVTFGTYNTGMIGELTDDGTLIDMELPKLWLSPKSNLGYPNQIKIIKEMRLLSKYDCEIEVITDKQRKTFAVKGKDTTQRIKMNVRGELVQIAFKSKGLADISVPELIVSVIWLSQSRKLCKIYIWNFEKIITLKGEIMYKYTFSDEDSEKLKEKTSISNNLLEKFKYVDKKYSISEREYQSPSLNLEKMTYEKPTQEEVNKQAENSLKEYKDKSLSSINDEYQTKLEKIDTKISEQKASTENEKQELEQLYGSLKKNASDEAVKRGLARSSIIVNQLEAFDRDMLDNYMKLDKEFKTAFSDLQAERDLLEVQKDNALSSFDISYAIKLEEKINSINDEIAKKEETVLKYNNDIAEKEAEYYAEQEELKKKLEREDREDVQDFIEFITKEGAVAYEDLIAKEKYENAYSILKDIPTIDAINELKNNSEYRKQLGRYYDKLLSILEG